MSSGDLPTRKPRKTSTERTRRWRERQRQGQRREVPDTKIIAFPRNSRGDDSAGAHLASWGPDHDLPPMTAGEVILHDHGKLIAHFTLHVVLKRGLGFYLRDCALVQWGSGQRVMLPQRSTTRNGKTYYADILFFDRNAGARAFEEAALSAARHAVTQLRAADATYPPADDGIARADHDDVPF